MAKELEELRNARAKEIEELSKEKEALDKAQQESQNGSDRVILIEREKAEAKDREREALEKKMAQELEELKNAKQKEIEEMRKAKEKELEDFMKKMAQELEEL